MTSRPTTGFMGKQAFQREGGTPDQKTATQAPLTMADLRRAEENRKRKPNLLRQPTCGFRKKRTRTRLPTR
jgi:hypothetical protein